MKILVITFILCAIVAVIMAAAKKSTPSDEPLNLQPEKKQQPRKKKVRSYDEHKKRMNKKQYLSEHSEYVFVSVAEIQELVKPGDKDVVDLILDALLNGDKTMKIKRDRYIKLKEYEKL